MMHYYLRQWNEGDYEIGGSILVWVSVCPSVCVHDMTNNSNDVIAPTAQAARPAVTLTSLLCSEGALPSASLSLCLHHFAWRR